MPTPHHSISAVGSHIASLEINNPDSLSLSRPCRYDRPIKKPANLSAAGKTTPGEEMGELVIAARFAGLRHD